MFLIVHVQSTLAAVGFVTSGAVVFPSNVVEHVVNILFIFALPVTPAWMQFFQVCCLKKFQEFFNTAQNLLNGSYFLIV